MSNSKINFILRFFYLLFFWALIFSFLNVIGIDQCGFEFVLAYSFLDNYTDGFSYDDFSTNYVFRLNYNFDNILLMDAGEPVGQQPAGQGAQPGGQPGGLPGGSNEGGQPQQGGQVNPDDLLRQSILNKIAFRETPEFKSIFSSYNVFSRTIYLENGFSEAERTFIVKKASVCLTGDREVFVVPTIDGKDGNHGELGLYKEVHKDIAAVAQSVKNNKQGLHDLTR